MEALHTAHKTFAVNGIHSRPLAELLLELDGERYLSASDREDVMEKSAALSQVRDSRTSSILADRPSETLPLQRASRHCSRRIARNPLTCPGHGRVGTGAVGKYSLVQVSHIGRVVLEGLGQHRGEPPANLHTQLHSCSLQGLCTTLCGPSVRRRPATSPRPGRSRFGVVPRSGDDRAPYPQLGSMAHFCTHIGESCCRRRCFYNYTSTWTHLPCVECCGFSDYPRRRKNHFDLPFFGHQLVRAAASPQPGHLRRRSRYPGG